MGHPAEAAHRPVEHKPPGCARRTAEGGCPHINLWLTPGLHSQGFLNFGGDCGGERAHFFFRLGFDHDSR